MPGDHAGRVILRTAHGLAGRAVDRPQPYYLFFFNDTATPEIYTLSLHDALPIWLPRSRHAASSGSWRRRPVLRRRGRQDRKSTRLNSSHSQISYAVFRLKKKTSNGATL